MCLAYWPFAGCAVGKRFLLACPSTLLTASVVEHLMKSVCLLSLLQMVLLLSNLRSLCLDPGPRAVFLFPRSFTLSVQVHDPFGAKFCVRCRHRLRFISLFSSLFFGFSFRGSSLAVAVQLLQRHPLKELSVFCCLALHLFRLQRARSVWVARWLPCSAQHWSVC